jgi:hypothetical protein
MRPDRTAWQGGACVSVAQIGVLEPTAVSALLASSLRSASGASRPESDCLARGEAAGSRLRFEPDDNVPDVGELRCAGRWGPGPREALRARWSRRRGRCWGVRGGCRCDGVLRIQTVVGGIPLAAREQEPNGTAKPDNYSDGPHINVCGEASGGQTLGRQRDLIQS